MSGRIKRLAYSAGICALGVLMLTSSSCKLDNLLFHTKTLSSYTLPSTVVPDSARQLVTLGSRGKTIYGFFVKSSVGRRDRTILYCHGNLESIEKYWDRVELLYRAGYSIFIFDYEGFGMSQGECSEEALYADGRAALEYVSSRPDVIPGDIIYYGYSLGCVVAIELAADQLAPKVLVCEAPFASGQSIVQSGTLLDVPGNVVLEGEYDNAAKIRNVHVPLLLFHGTDDRFVDITNNGQVVFDNANSPKKFIRVSGAGHTTIPWTMGADKYMQVLEDFIAAY
jgi:alpha-beta hydrolase superfamily lysophospholipase